MLKPKDFFDLTQTEHSDIFKNVNYAWDALAIIKEYISRNLKPSIGCKVPDLSYVDKNIYIGEGTIIEPGVMIKGPSIIGGNCKIRHGAYIRGNVIIGSGVVVGNSTEIKNSFLFNDVEVPHYNYVGDSILGYKAHLGAGVKLSNVKLSSSNVVVVINKKKYDTGLRKFGAIIGDGVEIGCNAVLNPGSVIGKNSIIYPCVSWRGYCPSNSIVKSNIVNTIIPKK